jgi:alginate O-acetyltransferase complex protein AlgI
MLFNSFHYLLFFPIVVILYFILPGNKKHIFLLAASYYFYMSWKPIYLVLILVTTAVSFFTAKFLAKYEDKKKLYLALCILINFGILFVFKYFNFFNGMLADLAGKSGSIGFFELKILLPVGISFYTFQTVSYVIDVYRDKRNLEKNFIFYALYVTYFPQLVAGPIERASNLLPQFRKEHKFDYDRTVAGIKVMVFGFFKKVVIADRISVVVAKAFADHAQLSSLNLFISVLLFGIQIYCDFSGYSDIAIGSARIMGIDLMVNFRRPYLAKGFRDFWSRWHISLSTWFKDYVYIPLGGNRKGKLRTILNTLLTFTLSGLWHGANYTFVLWGLLHGFFLVVDRFFSGLKRNFLWIFPTYILSNLAWVLFRASSLEQAIKIYTEIFRFSGGFDIKAFGLNNYQLLVMAMSIFVLMVHSIYKEYNFKVKWLDVFGYAAALIAVIFFGYFSNQEFIYFRF